MVLRWLHKSWKLLWGIVLTVLMVIIVAIAASIGLLQLDTTQDYLIDRIENRIERDYKGKLSVREVGGFVPFNIVMKDVVLTAQDSTQSDTVATIERLQNNIDIWSLLQNKVSITGFELENPEIWLRKGEGGQIVMLERKTARDTTADNQWLNDVEILAPQMVINEGTVHIKGWSPNARPVRLPSDFTVTNLNANFFVEWTDQQRFLDIESFSGRTADLRADQFSMTGQVYSDQRFLEFNSFFLNVGRSEILINGQIDGLDIGAPNVMEQFLAANYDLDVISSALYPEEFSQIIPSVPEVEGPFSLQLGTKGSTDSLWVDEVTISRGESLFRLNGLFKNLQQQEAFSYRVSIDSLNLRKQDIRSLIDSSHTPRYRALEDLAMKGTAHGSLDSVTVNLAINSPLGSLDVEGGSQLKSPHKYQGQLRGRNVDVSWLAPATFDTTSLNVNAHLSGAGYQLENANSEFEALFTDSRVDKQNFDRLQLKSSLNNEVWTQEYSFAKGEQTINGSGRVDFSREHPPVKMQGQAQNINLADIVPDTSVARTKLNFSYNIDAAGLALNEIRGKASFDVAPSVIGGDTVKAHQFYADITPSGNQRRSFRLTSSLFDMDMKGHILPKDIVRQTNYWSAYLKNRYQAEVKLDSTVALQNPIPKPEQNIVLDGNIKIKNLRLIKQYLPDFPSIYTDSKFTFNVNADESRLLFSAEMQADTLQFNQWRAKGSQARITASFRSDRKLKDFSSVDIEADMDLLRSDAVKMDTLGIDFMLEQDSIKYRQKVENIGENARFNFEVDGRLTDNTAIAAIKSFYLGNKNYAWTNQGTPVLKFSGPERVAFQNFKFKNKDEYFQLRGSLSASRDDSLSYTLHDINLARISELVEGRVEFDGILNGNLVTRSLTRQPTIQGNLDISRFALNNRTVGDVSFSSTYNQTKERFDTRIDVRTDPEKYAEYLKKNDGVQQNFTLDGYFVTPKPEVQQDSLFYFDADFEQIDMWVIPLIVDNLFKQMEGLASGKGYVSGNFDDFDFHADFEAKNVFAKPRFLNTNYFINGEVAVDRHEGVTLDSLSVMDTKGGTGRLWGNIDLNDFKPLTYLDLTFQMDQLQFLNSTMDPDVPFFGNISGSGTLRLSGSNTDMYLRSKNAIKLTNDSKVSIPLLEETELNESGKFIRFVDSFENRGKPKKTAAEKIDEEEREEQLRQQIQDLTFSERFDLDLRFETTNNIGVSLIFDPVTGDVLNARGSGQMRISMQDQEVQMFGRYQIDSGKYQFVTGEIISRKLDLQPGGTIVWEGSPDNARLDISAVYHARPNISTLTAEGPIESQEQSNSQQVPVDLIVDITGTLNSVENSYYFELPSSLDLSSNSTLSYTINQINRDEQQKLLQATSILFTGQFIPTQGAGSATASLSQNLTRGSTVLNPLLSNQVISPLLSNQINALLNSDVSRLDIDFNLNAYNEVDLGIALRLYNDRLILRREGQLTGGGPQTTLGDRIGDLNATYRISRRLSLTAFHRQNQILNNFGAQSQAGDVTPSVDGVGLEANFQFNNWQELWNKIFGISPASSPRKEDDEKNDKEENKKAEEANEK